MNKRSLIIALAVAIAVTLWVGSGYLVRDTSGKVEPASTADQPAAEMAVQVKELHARKIMRSLVNQGDARPDRTVSVRAETGGRVEKLLVARGQAVKAGEPLLQIAMEDREIRRRHARALVAQREAEYEAARSLNKKGFQGNNQLKESYALLEKAKAELEAIELDIARTTVRAPFDGILNDRSVEVGDYLSAGATVATVIDNDPLIVRVDVAQQHIGRVRTGGSAEARFITGESVQGTIRYVSSDANEATRTYPVEVAVPNPAGRLPAGMSVEVSIPVEEITAQFISPALLSLNDAGTLGVKSVDDQDKVVFTPVKIVRTQQDGMWVSGLPDSTRIIEVGQGFVRPGEKVKPVLPPETGDTPAKPVTR